LAVRTSLLSDSFCENIFLKLDTRQKKLIKLLIFFLSIALPLLIISLKILSAKWYWYIIAMEDGPVEYGTSIAYLLACILSFSISKGLYKQGQMFFTLLYVILSVGFIFICMEEVSWGQRIFHVQTPDAFMTYNTQKELTLHNMWGRQLLHGSYIIIGFYGIFARLILPGKIKKHYNSVVNLFVPDYLLVFYFLPVFILYVYYDYLSPLLVSWFGEIFMWGKGHFIHARDQEPVEFLLALGFLFFMMINKYRQVVYEISGSKVFAQSNQATDTLHS
jgi:hypothetical protein